MPRTEIPLNKTNMFFSFSGCLLFVIMGFYLLIKPPDAGTTWHPYAIKGFGGIVLLFFGIFAWAGARKLFDTTPALIIDENGITDNTTTAALGFVAWKDIAGIRKYGKAPAEFIV